MPVERPSACSVIRRIDDGGDFRRDPSDHDFKALLQRDLRRGAALAAAAHGDEQLAVAHAHQRNRAAVLVNGAIDLPVQQLLNRHAQLGV